MEPPCYEEMDDDDDDEESGYPGHSSSMLTPERPPHPLQPLTSIPHGHSSKSHSLPYKSRPFLPALSSSSSGEDDDEEEGSDEEANMLFYSLPTSLLLQAGSEGESETHKMADADAPPTAQPGQNIDVHSSTNARSRANAFSQSDSELERSVDTDWLVALARPREMVEHDGTDEEDGLELRKQMEEEETPANTTNRERDHLTNNMHKLG